MIKNLILLFTAFILISGCATTSEQADSVVGQWEYQLLNFPRGDPKGTLTIAKAGDSYSGTIANSQGVSKLADLSLAADNTLTAHFHYQGTRMKLGAVVDGNTISGQLTIRKTTYKFAGRRRE